MSDFRIPIDVLRDTFRDSQLERFLDEYLPHGTYEGPEYFVGSVAGEAGRSMAVHLRGAKRGIWRDFSGPSDHGGDTIDLVRHVLFRGDKAQAIRWMIGYCGLENTSHETIAIRRAEQRQRNMERKSAEAVAAGKKRARAFHIWCNEAAADLAGTPVEAYLAARGIEIALLPSTGALRFHPALYSAETERRYPAMVAAVTNAEGKIVACHRTWLDRRPDGRVVKAALEDPKKTLGTYAGGYISISKGAAGKTLPQAADGEHVMIAEGIEDCLVAALMFPEARIMAGLSLDNLKAVPVPVNCGRLTVIGDNDEGAAQKAKLAGAVSAQLKRGVRDVRLFVPENHKDLNDLWLAERARREVGAA